MRFIGAEESGERVARVGRVQLELDTSKLDISKGLCLDINSSLEDVTVIEPTRKLLRRAAEGV